MTSNDPRLSAALQAAVNRIRATAATAAARTVDGLGMSALAAPNMRQRDALLAAQYELGRKVPAFNQRFAEILNEKVSHEVRLILGHPSAQRSLEKTDWQSLSLVQDDEVEELVSSDRMGQAISHECEWELRELSTYMGSLLRTGHAEQDRNPIRPEIIGKALFRAVEVVSPARDTRALLTRELSRTLSTLMRSCYVEIVGEMQTRGIHPVGLSVKGVEGPGNDLVDEGPPSRFDSRYETGPGEAMLGLPSTGKPTDLDSRRRTHYPSDYGPPGMPPPSGVAGYAATPSGAGRRYGTTTGSHSSLRGTSAGYGPSSWRGEALPGRGGGHGGHAGHAGHGGGFLASVDPQMTALIRRLAILGGGGIDGSGFGAPGESGGLGATRSGFGTRGPGADFGSGPLSGLMSANLIHAHRDELRRAATGALDHMVIDVVGSLFDQILSDPKVPPQMARQIARLQLPVLRVALGDVTFFSSRRHPVRRFVNRIASLACAYDDLNEGTGLELVARVRDLVQEIIEGDFDQMPLYEAKIEDLEDFVAQSNEQEVEQHHRAASLLHGKEHELRLQQRYMQALKSGLVPFAMPEFLREFVTQVWSQTIMRVVHRDGATSDAAKRFRLAGRELIMSLQPKGSPAHRKQFLIKLPQLMKDLNEGLDLIGWPPAAKKNFFGHLLPAHAESLKGPPLSDLDHNLMAGEIDTVLARSVPQIDEAVRSDPLPMPELTDVVLENRFSPTEAEQIGLVPETAVDWDGRVDIEIDIGGEPELLLDADGEAVDASQIDIDIDGLPPADPPEPNHGAALMKHLQIGMAYQMLLKDRWQKVRLSFVSPGRAFFVFTHGKKHQETISMTSRMLSRMCETNRLRAFEHAYLLERATLRARKQLAALGAAAKVASAPPRV